MRLIFSLLINAVALWCAAQFVPGIHYTGKLPGLLILALIFGAINTIIKPILKLLSLPIRVVTLGLFTLVINAGLLMLTARIGAGTGFSVDGFVAALIGAILISVVSTFLGSFIAEDESDS